MNNKGTFRICCYTLSLIMMISGVLNSKMVLAGQYALLLEKQEFLQGEHVKFNLVFLQNSSSETALFPNAIDCKLVVADQQEIQVKARSVNNYEKHSAPAKALYHTQQYGFTLPENIEGEIIVHLTGLPIPAFLVQSTVANTTRQETTKEHYQQADSLFDLYQPYLMNISAFEPMYFLFGADPKDSKFQISFKYRLINNKSSLADSYPWLTGFHLGYTQVSFWDLGSDSTPFTDTSYKPEVFWQSENFLSDQVGTLQGVFLRTGLQHHSNGRGGENSRSTNYIYARPSLVYYDESSTFGLEIAPKFWVYVNNDDETNPALNDYQGYFEIEAKAGFADVFVLAAKYRWATEGHSTQIDLSYPLHRLFDNAIELYLYCQYSNTLAESLLDYSERTEAFRVGLSIVR